MESKVNSNFSLDKIYELLQKEEVTIAKQYEYIHPLKTKGKPQMLSLGRIWFNELLPDDYVLINEPISKPKMTKLIYDISNKYPPEKASDTIQLILQEAFKLSTIDPKSFTVDSFILSPDLLAKKAEFVKNSPKMSDDEFTSAANDLAKDLMKELEAKGAGIQDVINSKTKGGIDDWKALMISRGFVVDIQGKVSRITESNTDGYSIESFYKGGGQARRNYFIRTKATSTPGYLARRLTMACAHMSIVVNDCKTKKFLKINIDETLASRFIGRFYKDGKDLVEVKDASDLIGKLIEFRSPIYCIEENGLCQMCYGNLSKLVNNKNVGILAGGAINNETINALMKLRHKASQVNLISVDFIKSMISSSLDIDLMNKYFDIQKTKIIAKKECTIIIDEKDYRDDSISNLGDKFILPGIIDVILGEVGAEESITFPFNFDVDLYKADNTNVKTSTSIMTYIPGEIILEKESYIKDINAAIIDRLFEAGMKHITKPEILLNVLLNELTQADSCHLELIVANMFRNKEDPSIPGRLINYNNCKMIGAKEAPFIDSWLNALAFENPNKAIKTGLISNKDAKLNPIENIVLDKFYNEDAEK